MAVSRFRNLPASLDPTLYTYQPQEYIPDLGAIGAVTTGLQGIYDKLDYLDIPKHLQQDVADVRSRYIEPVEQLKEQAVNAFVEGDTGSGIRAIKDVQRFLHSAKQPGGVYTQFEQSYAAHQDYKNQLEKLYQDEKISADRKDILEKLSLQRFKGSFATGEYTPFSGISAAFEQDRLERGLKIGAGWKANKFPAGIIRTPQGYFRADTKERVDANEVFQGVAQGLLSDQAILNDLKQEALLRGLSGNSASEYIMNEVKKIAQLVGEKEGFEATDSKFLKDWVAEENMKQRNRYKLEDYKYNLGTGEHETRVYTVNTGMPELNLNDQGALDLNTAKKLGLSPSAYRLTKGIAGQYGASLKDTQAISEGFDTLIKNNPQFAESNQPLVDIVNEFPRLRTDNKVESDADYNKRIAKIYNKKRESLATASSVFTGYGPDRQADRNKTVIGSGEKLGDIQHKTLWLRKPGQPPRQFTYEQARDFLKLSDEEFIKKANILGDEKATSSIVPSGEELGITDNKGNTYQFTVENISYGDQVHKKDIYGLAIPLRDATVNETPWYVIGGEKVKAKGVDIWARDENGQIILDESGTPAQYRRDVHIIGEDGSNLTLGLDPQGNPIINPETGQRMGGMTLEQLEQINRATNPYSPLDFDKSGERVLNEKVPVNYE